MKWPKIDVIVVNYNGKDVLNTYLESLEKVDYPKNLITSILIDNNSSDGSVEFVKKKFPKTKIIASKENTGYVGVNLALPLCKGKYVYVINNDIILHKDCFKELVSVMEADDSIGMTTYRTINYFAPKVISGGTWVSKAMYCGHFQRKGAYTTKTIPYMGGGFIRRDVIDLYGYIFDPEYFIYAEDLDLGLRIRSIGKQVKIVDKAINYHMHAMTMKAHSTSANTTFLLERNLIMTFLRIFKPFTLLWMSPYVFGMRIASIGRDLLSGRLGNAGARMRALWWILTHLPTVLKGRRLVQKLRTKDDSYILKVFSEQHLLKPPVLV